MAPSHGSKAKAYANGYDLSGFFTAISSAGTADTAETSTLGKTSKTYIPGLKDATLSAEGLFDGDADAVDQVLAAALGADAVVWLHLPAGDGLGKPAKGFLAIETSYEVESPVDDVVSVTAEAQSTVGREHGIVLHALASESATGNGTSVDNSASSANGGSAYILATSAGVTSVTGKIQHSADNSSWADLVTMTAIASTGRSAERKIVTGTVNRYLRAVWTNGASAATPPFILAFARS